jgi:hypothetical protein
MAGGRGVLDAIDHEILWIFMIHVCFFFCFVCLADA